MSGRVSAPMLAALWSFACAPAPAPGAVDPAAANGTNEDSGLPAAPEMPRSSGRWLRPEEGGFEVLLPETASPPARSVEGDNHLAWESEAGQVAYSVEVIHAPGGIMNAEQFVERMRERVAQSGSVLDQRDGGPDGHPGFSMRLTGVEPDLGERLRVDLAVTRRHAFLLTASAPGDAGSEAVLDAPEPTRFFESFRAIQTTGLSRAIRSSEGRFEAEFAPDCGPAFKRVEIVDHKVHLSWVSEGEGRAQCMVALVRVDPLPTDEVLRAATDGAMRALPGAVVDASEDSMLHGAPRRSVRVHATVDGVLLHMRADFVYVDRALYQLQYVTSEPTELETPEVRAFFDSLHVEG